MVLGHSPVLSRSLSRAARLSMQLVEAIMSKPESGPSLANIRARA